MRTATTRTLLSMLALVGCANCGRRSEPVTSAADVAKATTVANSLSNRAWIRLPQPRSASKTPSGLNAYAMGSIINPALLSSKSTGGPEIGVDPGNADDPFPPGYIGKQNGVVVWNNQTASLTVHVRSGSSQRAWLTKAEMYQPASVTKSEMTRRVIDHFGYPAASYRRGDWMRLVYTSEPVDDAGLKPKRTLACSVKQTCDRAWIGSCTTPGALFEHRFAFVDIGPGNSSITIADPSVLNGYPIDNPHTGHECQLPVHSDPIVIR